MVQSSITYLYFSRRKAVKRYVIIRGRGLKMGKYTHQQPCDCCGVNVVYEWKCQLICPNCGAKLDCSDLFIEYETARDSRASQFRPPEESYNEYSEHA
jgi:PHP family Zn ribbon phosphoesterase